MPRVLPRYTKMSLAKTDCFLFTASTNRATSPMTAWQPAYVLVTSVVLAAAPATVALAVP